MGSAMTLLIAADALPPLPFVDADEGAAVQVHYYDELLKSALQKAVRRMLPWSAVRLCYQLLLQSPDECLRRLPVIVMEDGLAHPRLPFLVWLMIAHTKGWSLGLQHVLDLLQIVYEVASCKWRDSIPSDGTSCVNPFLSNEVGEDQEARGLIASMVLRACYGGMKGDIRFLRAFAQAWHRRFQHHPQAWREVLQCAYAGFKGNEVRLYFYSNRCPEDEEATPSRPLQRDVEDQGSESEDQMQVSDIAVLRRQDMLKEGVDMHCHPKIIDQLAETDAVLRRGITPAQIKSAIWHHRSGVNHKRLVCLGLHPGGDGDGDGDEDGKGKERSADPPPEDDQTRPPDLGCSRQHSAWDFDQAATEVADVWLVVEPELDRIVAEGSFWKSRPAPQQQPEARARQKKKARGSASEASSGLAQPTLEFFKAKAATAAAMTSRPPRPSPSEPVAPPVHEGRVVVDLTTTEGGATSRKRKKPSSSSSSSQMALTSFLRPPKKE